MTIALNSKNDFIVIGIAFLTILNKVHISRNILIALIKVDKAFKTVVLIYSNFVDILFLELIAWLLEYAVINNHAINMVNGK